MKKSLILIIQEEVHLSKDTKRHPQLNYLLDAPLPYFLTDEELYGKYSIDESQYSDYGKKTLLRDAEIFVNFLNNSSSVGPHGKVPTIDETVFVKSFLPYFYSEKEVDDKYDEGYPNGGIITVWVRGVAGGAYTAVNVTRNGEVIYRVPPAYGRLNAVGPADRERSLNLLLKDAEDVYSRIPAATDAQITYALDLSTRPADPDADRHSFLAKPNLKYLFVMDEIFTYYGYDSILPPEIMSIKNKVFGENYVNHRQSGTTVSSNAVGSVAGEPVEDDSDLFG